jgi:hypothetical protein
MKRLTRYKLGIIKEMHDRADYTSVDKDYLAQQLRRIGLPPKVSRFELAQRIKELELERN